MIRKLGLKDHSQSRDMGSQLTYNLEVTENTLITHMGSFVGKGSLITPCHILHHNLPNREDFRRIYYSKNPSWFRLCYNTKYNT